MKRTKTTPYTPLHTLHNISCLCKNTKKKKKTKKEKGFLNKEPEKYSWKNSKCYAKQCNTYIFQQSIYMLQRHELINFFSKWGINLMWHNHIRRTFLWALHIKRTFFHFRNCEWNTNLFGNKRLTFCAAVCNRYVAQTLRNKLTGIKVQRKISYRKY